MREDINILFIWNKLPHYLIANICKVNQKANHFLLLQIEKSNTVYHNWEINNSDLPFKHYEIIYKKFKLSIIKELFNILRKCQYEWVIIPGISNYYAYLLGLILKAKGKYIACWWASTFNSRKKKKIIELIKKVLIIYFDIFLVPGTESFNYLKILGIKENKIHIIKNCIDNNMIYSATNHKNKNIYYKACDKAQISNFIFVGRLIEEKNIYRLLRAFKICQFTNNRIGLTLIGTGIQEKSIRDYTISNNIKNIDLAGFKQPKDIANYFSNAICLILPSIYETWGLVVNEAMAAGLPVLVSRACGCAPDLVQEGINGFTFDPYDVDGLARLMVRMSSGEVDLQAMGRASRKIIADWTPEVFAENLFKALEAAREAKRSKR
jgi:glycosyltransferase involved in cell wall biosynthesis